MTLLFTMIPTHNPLLCPDYWYEMILAFTPFHALACFYWAISWSIYLNIDYIKGNHRILMVVFMGVVASHLTLFSAYFAWTHVAKYPFPVPDLGRIVFLIMLVTSIATFWFSFPFEWRKKQTFRRRLKFFLLRMIHNFTLAIQFNGIFVALLDSYQNEYQPIIAVLFRAILELNLWIGKKITSMTADGDEDGAQLILSVDVGILYTMVVCFAIENIATSSTEITLMGLDFAYNVYISLKIVWLNKCRPADRNQQMELLQDLGSAELIEFTTPLVFILSTVVGYYGPNSNLLLNVRATVWHSVPIEDINQTSIAILRFFAVDFGSTIVTSIILWGCCKINLFKALAALMKEHWPILCLILTTHTYGVCNLCFYIFFQILEIIIYMHMDTYIH